MGQGRDRTLLVEGWRSIPHSYALVNQYQLLELLRQRDAVRVLHRDLPFHDADWRAQRGILDEADERLIAAIPSPAAGEPADASYRIGFPYDFCRPAAPRSLVFATSEYGFVPEHAVAPAGPLRDALRASDCVLVTPSSWSREGLLREGAAPERVAVVPHGADLRVFRPLPPAERAALRAALGLDSFTFLTVGAATLNKGSPLLFKAFAALLERHPDARLVLKGLDALYPSREFVPGAGASLTAAERERVQPRLVYLGETWDARRLATLYQAADAYVSPYLAEGFNLPVLEAAACGTLAICTAGGPTDDFTTEEFALRIGSRRAPAPQSPRGILLQPDAAHLAELMLRAVETPSLRERARAAGPRHVAAGFTWRHAAERLLALAFPAS
jgi:glycosyltransferase involved in cell wall biosynthesis